jgi:carbon-monoxide dehydrogenase small subunit
MYWRVLMHKDRTDFTLECTVNGKTFKKQVRGEERLVDFLREDLGLLGTKEGCGVGECGACTIIFNGKKINSCMILAAQAQGAEVLTIEGLENADGSLHPLQQAFIDAGAIQCGFCTPGMVLSAYELLLKTPDPSVEDVKMAISGNLCRCTGYQQIIEAIQLAAKMMAV